MQLIFNGLSIVTPCPCRAVPFRAVPCPCRVRAVPCNMSAVITDPRKRGNKSKQERKQTQAREKLDPMKREKTNPSKIESRPKQERKKKQAREETDPYVS